MRGGVCNIVASVLVAVVGLSGPTAAQQKPPIPHGLLSEHKTTLAHLHSLAREHGAVGVAAKHVLAVMVPHVQREEEFVLPLLGVIDELVDGKIGPDMAWAIAMSDRVVAERSKLYDEHTAIIDALNELAAAGRARHDANLVAFAEEVASEEVNDGEFVYPAAILAGKLVREKLAAK
jgi:hypothetical protein